MKLASSVITPGGQRVLAAGVVLDDENICLLRDSEVRYIQIIELSGGEEVDAGTFSSLLQDLKLGAADAPAVEAPSVEPVEPAVPDYDTMDADQRKRLDRKVQDRVEDLRQQVQARKQRYTEKFGVDYTTVSYAIGESKPYMPAGKPGAVYADFFSTLARSLIDQMAFERSVDQEALDMLTSDVVGVMSKHEPLMDLMSSAYSASRYLLTHTTNVGVYAMRVTAAMGLSSKEITNIAIGALLHDIGMILIPVSLWTTRRELSPRAREEINRHPELGAKLIETVPGAKPEWIDIALNHHERLDGSGYPAGKTRDDLSLAARVVMICDVYEAMTSDRSYRYARFPDQSMKQLLGNPAQFDRDIAQIFCRCMGFYPEGYTIKLSTGESAIVMHSNPRNVFRPLIRLSAGADNRALPEDRRQTIDLAHRPDLRVVHISNRRAPIN